MHHYGPFTFKSKSTRRELVPTSLSEAMGMFSFTTNKLRKVIAFVAGWQAAAFMALSTLPIRP